jgi:phage terminase small subunit
MAPQLTPKQRAFCEQYLIDLNGTQAAIRAGYSPKTAGDQAAQLMAQQHVRDEIQRLTAARAADLSIEGKEVLRILWDIATADTNEIVQHRRVCCRYCHGKGHRYQRTPAEREQALASHELRIADMRANGKEPTEQQAVFDEHGGIGFDPRKDPHPDCPECHGEGLTEIFVQDTRVLTGGARTLYAGVKQTKDGIEIKMHDRTKATELVGKHLRLFIEKLELSGHLATTDMSDEELRAEVARLRATHAPTSVPDDASDLV